MNPTELINPRCKLTGTVPVIRSTRHLFLDLPKLSNRLQDYIDRTSQLGGWSANCVQVGPLALWEPSCKSFTTPVAGRIQHLVADCCKTHRCLNADT